MTLVIRQYLASLRERDELDAILPDLLSQMGLVVFSRPGRGTRQYGVDVGAVGRVEKTDEQKVYLFAIKSGDLRRKDWEGTPQALRPSLISILDVYIPNHLPVEHRGKSIVICTCIGGDVREEVRLDWVSFAQQYETDTIKFEEWNGDRLAKHIERSFLREELVPRGSRSNLRKAIALLDEPQSSFVHFARLITALGASDDSTPAAVVTAIRQMNLFLRILYVWCRDAGNTEAAFRAAELTLLHGWTIFRDCAPREDNVANDIQTAFLSIYDAYQEICGDFLKSYVVPHSDKLHGLSSGVRGSCGLDVNLKLFDLVGRVGIAGLWTFWTASRASADQEEEQDQMLAETRNLATVVKLMVTNNPALLMPVKEDQAIDLAIALLLLGLDEANARDIRLWLGEIISRSGIALRSHGQYPSTLDSYAEILKHPELREDEYREKVTQGSVLYPLIAVWAALLDDHEVFAEVAKLKGEVLGHCTFQYWYPDEMSEDHLYAGDSPHGSALTDVRVDGLESDLLAQLFSECDATLDFDELTAVKYDWWPVVAVACRHHRLPLPLHLVQQLWFGAADSSAEDGAPSSADQSESESPNQAPAET